MRKSSVEENPKWRAALYPRYCYHVVKTVQVFPMALVKIAVGFQLWSQPEVTSQSGVCPQLAGSVATTPPAQPKVPSAPRDETHPYLKIYYHYPRPILSALLHTFPFLLIYKRLPSWGHHVIQFFPQVQPFTIATQQCATLSLIRYADLS